MISKINQNWVFGKKSGLNFLPPRHHRRTTSSTRLRAAHPSRMQAGLLFCTLTDRRYGMARAL